MIFAGIIHSMHGVLLVRMTGISVHNCVCHKLVDNCVCHKLVYMFTTYTYIWLYNAMSNKYHIVIIIL